MLRFGLLPLAFEPAALQLDLQRLVARHWAPHFNTGYHDGGWSGLSLVSDDGTESQLHGRSFDASEAVEPASTPALAMAPALQQVLAALPCTVQSARLLRLAPGSVIREHRDDDLGLDRGLVRLHVPITCPPVVEFYVDGVRVPMREGECWYLDLRLNHRVSNPGPDERVHLVIDCRISDALLALLPAAAAAEAEVAARQSQWPPTAMQRFEQFRDAALTDAALLEQFAATGPDVEDFLQAVVQAGADRGWVFGPEEVRAALNAGRRAWHERHAAFG